MAESTEKTRASGLVPAVLYGPKEKAASVVINGQALVRAWKEAGETTVVKLQGVGEDKESLFHDVQFHPVTGDILHADFYVLEKGKKIRLKVPIEFTGASLAEKAGHILVKTLYELEIEVLPAELPKHLVVDVTPLANVGDKILAQDVKLPASAELHTHAEEIIAAVTEFKEEAPLPVAGDVVVAEQAGDKKPAAEEAEGEEKK